MDRFTSNQDQLNDQRRIAHTSSITFHSGNASFCDICPSVCLSHTTRSKVDRFASNQERNDQPILHIIIVKYISTASAVHCMHRPAAGVTNRCSPVTGLPPGSVVRTMSPQCRTALFGLLGLLRYRLWIRLVLHSARLSVCLSVCPVTTIYSKLKCRRNFIFVGHVMQELGN